MKKHNIDPLFNCGWMSFLASISFVFVFTLPGCARHTEDKTANSIEALGGAIRAREADVKLVTEWSVSGDRSILNGDERHFFADESSWAQIWSKLHGVKAVPDVNFDKYLVYVDWVDSNDPNIRDVTFSIDSRQTLSVTSFKTLMGFSESEFLDFDFYLVSREGISKW